jgi:hypothetical protein
MLRYRRPRGAGSPTRKPFLIYLPLLDLKAPPLGSQTPRMPGV